MPKGVKIATCCYCGTRAALTLRGTTRHELACAACGAPLHDLKRLREDHGGKPAKPKHRVAPQAPQRRRKRGKPLWRKALGEAFEAIEDILD